MDKYNHWLGRLFSLIFYNGKPYAVTLGQTTYYSGPSTDVSPQWRRHEDEHKKQWARHGKVRFLSRYIWQWITKGYDKIDYEVEARAAELNRHL